MAKRRERVPSMGVVEATLTRRRKAIERRIKELRDNMAKFAALEIELKSREAEIADIERAIAAVKQQ